MSKVILVVVALSALAAVLALEKPVPRLSLGYNAEGEMLLRLEFPTPAVSLTSSPAKNSQSRNE